MFAAARRWIYPASVKGRFQRVHRATGVVLQAILFVTPWILVGGRPAVQLDIGERRAFLLGHVFTPQDTIFLVLMALIAAFSLFFFTALYGRLWCGFACPQTVFLEEWIRPIERFVEGERGVRMARDRKGWTFDRAWRKAAKWTLFALLATVVGMTFTSWFAGARPLWTGAASGTTYGVAAFFSIALFFDFAWFREQFCNYLCPYARFQGALTDDGSLAVAYDVKLGEPRKGAGRCIGCEKCVAVCPQGIDIRQGFQLECIACARCVDACTGVMAKKGYPSLIEYRPIEEKPLLRPRTLAYGGLLVALSLAFVGLMVSERDLEASISRAPGTLYTVDADGWVRNTFLLRVSNDSLDAVDVTVGGLDLPPGADLTVIPIHVDPAGQAVAPVVVRMPPEAGNRRTVPLTLTVATDRTRVLVDTTFKTGG